MAFHGLFIGIDRYASPRVSWLTCARRDAVALHALCADTFGDGGRLLTDDFATRTGLEREFALLSRCNPDDDVVIAFSGHGSSTHELVTFDADPADLPGTCVSLTELTEWFARIPARRLVCFLDCCFSGGMGAKVLVSDLVPRDLGSPENALDKLSGAGRLILTASRACEPAWESTRAKHGLLTYYLLEALQGAGEVREAGKIPVYQLLQYVTRRVADAAAQFGKVQHPTLRGQIDGELSWPVFSAGPAYFAAFPDRSRLLATSDIRSLAGFGLPQSAIETWAQTIPALNEMQLAAINDYGLLRGEHLVISAPTSSGKTMAGELAALRGVSERKRTVFLFPLKALVNDKHRYFAHAYGPLGVRTVMATGDASPEVSELMRGRYDLALLTYEKFSALLLANPHVIEQVGTIVVDEVQMIADPSRGANLEFILTLLRARRTHGIEPQLILLSAVVGDTNGLERWLGARLLRHEERPVPLREGLLLADGRYRHLDPSGAEQMTEPLVHRLFGKGSGQDWIIPLVGRLVSEGKKVIVFREQKGQARGCAAYLAKHLGLTPATGALAELPSGDPSGASRALREAMSQGVAFHNADLDQDERAIVEKHFRAPDSPLRVIAATTTLAMGVNTPAEAVIIEGLEHPGPQPYTVAEYKNMVGRAGRLGFATEGTSYLLAWEPAKERYYWERYVRGVPEDLQSQLVGPETDPRSLLLRVLVGAAHVGASGMTVDQTISFLESSFGAFQRTQATPAWKWDVGQLHQAFESLESHRLVRRGRDGLYEPTELGRLAGEAGVHVESVIRLVEALAGIPVESVNDPTLIAATQLTVELDEMLFPINKSSTVKEPQTWDAELRRQKIPAGVMAALHHNVTERHRATLRAKKATACLLWISGRPMQEIERSLTQFGGAPDGAAGPVRSISARTGDLLPVSSRVAEILHPGLVLGDRISRLLIRLELGVPAAAVSLATHAGNKLGRGDYQRLTAAGLSTVESISGAPDEALLECVGGSRQKLEVIRGAGDAHHQAAVGFVVSPAPILPDYEP